MKELIIMLGSSKVDFEKKTVREGGQIKSISVSISTDGNGAVTTFVFNKDEELQYVTHN